MTVDRSQVGWRFWLQWVLASTFGGGVGMLLGVVVVSVIAGAESATPEQARVGWAVGLAVAWAVGGAMQWYVLRSQVSRGGSWVLATAVGWAVAWAAGWAVGEAVRPAVGEHAFWVMWGPLFNPVVVAVGGAVGGAMQWLVLRSQVSRAGWWVLASTVGWLVGPLVGFLVGGAVGDEDSMFFLSIIPLWAVAGAITGIALVWLLRQPTKEA